MSRMDRRAALAATAALLLAGTALPALAQVAGPVISFGDSLPTTATSTSSPAARIAALLRRSLLQRTGLHRIPERRPDAAGGRGDAGGVRINPELSQNYAFGNARTDRLDGLLPPGIPAQIDAFELQDGRFGANDVVTLYGAPTTSSRRSTRRRDRRAGRRGSRGLGRRRRRLARPPRPLGAPTVAVLNLPDIGATPAFSATLQGSVAGTLATNAFNTALRPA